MNDGPRESESEPLRDLYRDDYVARYHQSADSRLQRVVDLMDLGAGMRVVDFACGSGLLHDLLRNVVADYTGVDFSQEFISEARRRQHPGRAEARFVCQSIRGFCTAHPGEFDRAFAMDFAEHVHSNELLPIVRAIRSSLKLDGQFYLHTPDGEFILEVLKERGWMRQLEGHVAVRSRIENVQLLEAAGFREIEAVSLPHYLPAFAWLHGLRHLPLIGRYLRARIFLACRP